MLYAVTHVFLFLLIAVARADCEHHGAVLQGVLDERAVGGPTELGPVLVTPHGDEHVDDGHLRGDAEVRGRHPQLAARQGGHI